MRAVLGHATCPPNPPLLPLVLAAMIPPFSTGTQVHSARACHQDGWLGAEGEARGRGLNVQPGRRRVEVADDGLQVGEGYECRGNRGARIWCVCGRD